MLATAPPRLLPEGYTVDHLSGQEALACVDELLALPAKHQPPKWLEACVADETFIMAVCSIDHQPVCCVALTGPAGHRVVIDACSIPAHRRVLSRLVSSLFETEKEIMTTTVDHAADTAIAPNYHPLPITIASAEGCWVYDVEGNKYLDALAGYSALNFGHQNPDLVEAATKQLGRVTLTSRAFGSDQLGPFCEELAALCGKDMVLPMNTGAEAVESAIKVARRYGYAVRKVAEDQANIITMAGNFHGRTTTIVSFSDDEGARENYGPFTPGFRSAPYGDADAIEKLIDANTVAILVEPVQGEAGIIVPPAVFLPRLRQICDQTGILLIADEIQSGMCRTGATFACDLAGVKPDIYCLGKALGGGIIPVSAIVANADILGVLTPGSHGSTFGGNPLAAAVGREVIRMVNTGKWQKLASDRGAELTTLLTPLVGKGLTGFRNVGLWAGVDIDPQLMSGREAAMGLMKRGVLAKETHGSTIRFAPPLTITAEELVWMIDQLRDVLASAQR